jgi:hypothetical protein
VCSDITNVDYLEVVVNILCSPKETPSMHWADGDDDVADLGR